MTYFGVKCLTFVKVSKSVMNLDFKRKLVFTGCPQKGGKSKFWSVCFHAHLMFVLGYLSLIHLKIEIHIILLCTEPFLCNIRELRHKIVKNPIWYQPLASSHLSSIKTILLCWVNSVDRLFLYEYIKTSYIRIEKYKRTNNIYSVLHDDSQLNS